MAEKICAWCQNHKGNTELNFCVIDDDFMQYVHRDMIKYCPFCGRYVGTKPQQKSQWKSAMMRTFLGGE